MENPDETGNRDSLLRSIFPLQRHSDMMREVQYNLSPGIDLKTAVYLTDPQILEEYERLQNASFRAESTLSRLRRNPKFRRRVLQWSRLGIFVVLVWAGISTISHLGLWNDIYTIIITAL